MARVQLAVLAVQSSDVIGFEYKERIWHALIELADVQLLIDKVPQFIQIKVDKRELDAQLICAVPAKCLPTSILDTVLNVLFHKPNTLQALAPDASCTEQMMLKRYMTTQLYDALYERHREDFVNLPELKLPERFKPLLRRYQKYAVNWLLRRELDVCTVSAFYTQLVHLLHMPQHQQQYPVYKHDYCAHLLQHMPSAAALPAGGILADEMGLGKTVEMLALILLHPFTPTNDCTYKSYQAFDDIATPKKRRIAKTLFCFCSERKTKAKLLQCTRCKLWQHAACVAHYNDDHNEDINEPYMCPSCWAKAMKHTEPLPSRATFIVSPATIKSQWLSEIERHVQAPPLRVLVYNGCRSGKWISPRQLANYDVVLCDYTVLRGEFYLTDTYTTTRTPRNAPLFMRLQTPLLMLHWWRVCLDEAQMVESNASNVTKLVRMLPAVNRWAVSGTPIQRSLDDLVPLLHFIGFPQACEPIAVWHTLVHDFVQRYRNAPASQLHLIDRVLRHCMWRTCKSKVIDELGIPPQSFVVHRIPLSNIEKLFYTEMHKECEDMFKLALAKYVQNADESIKTISPMTLNLILKPLVKLRQTCNISVVHLYGQAVEFMQPEKLHAHLKATNITACKDALRSMASSYNGMAANHFLSKRYDEAIRCYQLTLKLADEYKDKPYYVDSMLQIHALYNMLQAYYTSDLNENGETLASYEAQCNALEAKYLERCLTQLTTVKNAFNTSWQRHVDLTDEVNIVELIADAITHIEHKESSLREPLMSRVLEECKVMFADKPTINELQSTRGILYVLDMWYTNTMDAIIALQKKLNALEYFTANVGARNQVETAVWRRIMQFVHSVYECHLSNIRKKSGKANDMLPQKPNNKKTYCELCQINKAINQLECLIFRKTMDEETSAAEGISSPSAEMTLIKSICGFLKSRTSLQPLQLNIDKQLEILENMQTLFKRLTKFWIEIEYTVKAYDELDMCKMRMTFRYDEDSDDSDNADTNWQIRECELDEHLQRQKYLVESAQYQFTMKLARLKYIMHLEEGPGKCPICHTEDENRYAVLICGHHICLVCLKFYVQPKNLFINCPICRNRQSIKNLYYGTRNAMKDGIEGIKIEGDFSMKIMHILHLVMKMQHAYQNKQCVDEPKVLIFSQWYPVLTAISKALTVNKITHSLRWSPKTIEDFKNPNLGITCLLMTLNHGSKGLNLVEANTVILVEPILNPGEELQAIGRVHRFGQTKPTTVHRFIVEGTIEENIFNTITGEASAKPNWEFDNMTLADLRDLFKLETNCSI